MVGKIYKSFIYNIEVIGLKPHVVIFKIIFFKGVMWQWVLGDTAMSPNELSLNK